MGNTAGCCVRRDDEGEKFLTKVDRCESWHSLPDVTEEQWCFFEQLDMVSEGSEGSKGSEDDRDKPSKKPKAVFEQMAPQRCLPAGPSNGGKAGEAVFEQMAPPRCVPAGPSNGGKAGEVDVKAVLLPLKPAQRLRRKSSMEAESEFPRERSHTWVRLRSNSRALNVVPEETVGNRGRLNSLAASPMTRCENQAYLHLVEPLREKVRKAWEKKLEKKEALDQNVQRNLAVHFNELEDWTDDETCLRMLRAVLGEIEQSATMLTKAIECRVRDREFYTTLTCDVRCDIRIIGRDMEQRPVVYLCAQSQQCKLKEVGPQVMLAFEAAVRLSDGDDMGKGKVLFIADMHGFSTSLNMDATALRELAGSFGSVFADRFCYILVVDFSFLAQTVWAMCKPMLSERTQKKINFVGLKEAKKFCKERLSGPTHDRVVSAFDINRAKGITAKEKEEHAKRTAICDVPLGSLRPADSTS